MHSTCTCPTYTVRANLNRPVPAFQIHRTDTGARADLPISWPIDQPDAERRAWARCEEMNCEAGSPTWRSMSASSSADLVGRGVLPRGMDR